MEVTCGILLMVNIFFPLRGNVGNTAGAKFQNIESFSNKYADNSRGKSVYV